MIGEILNALKFETAALLKDTGALVIFKTDYQSTKLNSYAMPLVILDTPDAPETGQYLGGVTRFDLVVAFNVYNYDPNSMLDDTSGFSEDLLNIIETVQNHFSFGRSEEAMIWLTQSMMDMENNYGFVMSLTGQLPAEPLDQDGLIKGMKVVYDTMGIDQRTAFIATSVEPENVSIEVIGQLNGVPPIITTPTPQSVDAYQDSPILIRTAIFEVITVSNSNDIVARPGTCYRFNPGVLQNDITFDFSLFQTEGDYVEISNNEETYTISFIGGDVYLADGVTTITEMAVDTTMQIRLISSKLRIIN